MKPLQLPPRYMDTYAKLTKHRALIISEDFSDEMAEELSAMLLYLNNKSQAPITLYIHSNGGAATGLVHIYDVMQMISAPVSTINIGKAYSAGAVILASGTKGLRKALKHSSTMIHGVQVGYPIPGHDAVSSKNYFEFLKANNDIIMKMLARHTGQPLSKVKEDCKEDIWMDAKKALEYGIIDQII